MTSSPPYLRNAAAWPGGHLHRSDEGGAILGPPGRWEHGDWVRLPDGSHWEVSYVAVDGMAIAWNEKVVAELEARQAEEYASQWEDDEDRARARDAYLRGEVAPAEDEEALAEMERQAAEEQGDLEAEQPQEVVA
jgi:hypothetical protein